MLHPFNPTAPSDAAHYHRQLDIRKRQFVPIGTKDFHSWKCEDVLALGVLHEESSSSTSIQNTGKFIRIIGVQNMFSCIQNL